MSVIHRPAARIQVLVVTLALAALSAAPATSANRTQTALPAVGGAIDHTLGFCDDNAVPANDDYWTEAGITPPFPLTFFGEDQTRMFVNNNGNVTFKNGFQEYTPSAISAGARLPIIAPFWADFDTSAEGSGLTTYGWSADGKTFCAEWIDLGYFDKHMDKTNSVQLLLQSRENQQGRSPGDFDITFNYDRITWESGDASPRRLDAAGVGGVSAVVGFSPQQGRPGTALQLPGSLVNGAFLDGGPNSLVAGSYSSTQPGRYVFEVRNARFLPPAPAPLPVSAKKASTTVLKLSAKKIRVGEKVRVAVKVTTATGGSAKGSVLIKDGRKVVTRIAKLRRGKGSVTLKNLKRGTHRIKAVFSGNSTTLRSASKVVKLRAS